jgi:hypothetical protein
MNPKRAQRILDETYATLERTADIPSPDLNKRAVQERIDAMEVPRREKMQRSMERNGLMYKTTDNGAVMPQQEEPQDWSAWNDWCNALIKAAIEQHQAMIIEAVGQALGEERRMTREAFQQALAKVERACKTRIKKLENEITLLRSMKGNVTTISRKAD